MSIFIGPLAALMLSGGSPLPIVPASYSQDAPQSSDQVEEEDETDRLFNAFFDQLYDKQYKDALKTAGKIDVGEDNPQGTAVIAVMRAAAMLGLERDAEATRLLAEADRLASDPSGIDGVAFTSTLIVGRFALAADYFDRLVAKSPQRIREMDAETVWHFLRNEPKEQETRNDDRRVALARLGYGGEDGDYFAREAVEILTKRGDIAGANELLPYIDDPQAVENLLIQKRLSALWPRLESLAGPHLERVRASSAGTAERGFAAAPRDGEKLQQLVNALRHTGRYEEAMALRPRFSSTSEAMAKADEQAGWGVNNLALAMHEAGRADEADALFALLNDAPMEEGRWRVSMKINRLELLVSDGRFDKALPLLDLTEASARDDGNAYAQQLVRRLRFCTISGLGRKEEAAKLLPDLLKHAEDAPGPTVDGLVCAGELDHAEKLALDSLKKGDFEIDFIRALQARPLTSDDPSVWDQGWKSLRQRPAIAKEFDRLGRDMPEHLLVPGPAKPGTQAAK